MLRGSSASVVDGHKMSIAVSEPHKAKGILFGGVLYTIITKYGDENGENFGNKTFYSVPRSYNDIVNLYQFLMLSYKKDGVVIPPPPIKGNLGLIEKVTTVRSENLSSSSASRYVCIIIISIIIGPIIYFFDGRSPSGHKQSFFI